MQKKPRKLHGGDIYHHPDVIDFSVNTNPLGTPESVKRAVQESVAKIEHYPDVRCEALREAISRFEQVNMEEIFCGNGAAELFFTAVQAVWPQKALVIAPSFSEYEEALRSVGAEVEYYYLCEEDNFQIRGDYVDKLSEEIDMIFLCNPNNPTGQIISPELMKQIVHRCMENQILLVVDECFLDFSEEYQELTAKRYLKENPYLIVLKAFTKTFALAGARLGYLFCSNDKLREKIVAAGQPWAVSSLAQAAGKAALENAGEYLEKTREYVKRERDFLQYGLTCCGYQVYNSHANYLFFFSEDPDLVKKMRQEGILIRGCDNYRGLGSGYYRIAVRRHEDNVKLLNAFERI